MTLGKFERRAGNPKNNYQTKYKEKLSSIKLFQLNIKCKESVTVKESIEQSISLTPK